MFLFLPSTTKVDNANDWNTENISKETENVDYTDYLTRKETDDPKVWNITLDIDNNGKNDEIVVKSYPGFPGDQNTELYISQDKLPLLTEIGYFNGMQMYKMDTLGHHILELQLLTGQSINTLFYTYEKGKLNRVSVSTENSPSWYGIVSRNPPELKDIDNDGVLDLLAYYNFLYDPTRTVEVYKFKGHSFTKIKEYEEVINRG